MPPKKPRPPASPAKLLGSFKEVQSYAKYRQLYPSLATRVRAIIASDIPFVRERLASMDTAVEQRSREHYSWFTNKYGLTPMQARIAVFIAEGGSVAEYAETAAIAPATVRSHLKAIFKKTGTTRQAELATILMRRGTAL